VPASFARKMGADFVIAVDISQRPESGLTASSFDVLMQTFTIMGQTIKAYELDKYADIVIRPNLAAMSGSDFSQRNATQRFSPARKPSRRSCRSCSASWPRAGWRLKGLRA
jgi:predicted acylesterase/phospholipase RssA